MPSLRKRKHVNMAEQEDSGSGSGGSDNDLGKDQGIARPAARTPGRTPQSHEVQKSALGRARQRKPAAFTEGCSILEVIKQPRGDLTAIAKSWIRGYRTDQGDAMASLLTFFVQAAGCLCDITKEEVEEGDTDKIMRKALKSAQEDGIDDHFKGKGAKWFSDNYVEWWEVFVREAAVAEVLFDSIALERLLNLVVTMASSVIRNFRVAATTAAMRLMTAMVRVMNALSDETDTAQRQLDIETKRKGGGQVAAQRALKRAVDQSHHRNSELKSHIEGLFDSVAAHRFRDVSEEVRTCVIEAVGRWIVLRPATFLDDKYLKYIGWALSDKDAIVRLAAASVLLDLYEEEAHISMLSKFTMRFAGRYAELVYDVSEAVSVKGIQLMTRLASVGAVEGTAMQDVYRLLVDDSAAVRRAAAALVADLLPTHGARLLQGTSRETGRHSDTELQLAGLMYIAYLLANNEEDEADTVAKRRESIGSRHVPELALEAAMAAHIVDALFDDVPLLGSEGWQSVVAVLKDGSCGGEDLTPAQATNLLLLLQFGVRRACGNAIVALPHHSRKAVGKAAKAAADDAQRTATLLFMKALPDLLPMYQTEPAQAAALAGIFAELRMDVWALKSEENALASLLQQVADMFLKHVHPVPLSASAAALAHASSSGTDSTQEQAAMVAEVLCSRVSDDLGAAAAALDRCSDSQLISSQAGLSADSSPAGVEARNTAFALTAGLARAEHLLTLLPQLASQPNFHEALQQILQAGAEARELGPDILGAAARCALMVLLWRLSDLRRSSRDSNSSGGSDREAPVARAACQELAKLRSTLVALLEATMQSTHEDAVREAVALVLGDLYLAFSSKRLAGPLAAAAADPNDDALYALWVACEDVLSLEPDGEGSPDNELQLAAEAEAAEALSRRQQAVALLIGRLVVFGDEGSERDQLAARLLSHAYCHGPAVESAAKEVCRMLKKGDGARLPRIHSGAIVESWVRCKRTGFHLKEAQTVADRVAAYCSGFNANGPAVAAICEACGEFALRNAPANIEVLKLLKPFINKLTPEAAATWAARLQQQAGQQVDESADEWQWLLTTLEWLADKANKRKTPKTAKQGTAAAEGSTPGQLAGTAPRTAARRITFGAASESPSDSPAPPSATTRTSGSASITRRKSSPPPPQSSPSASPNDPIEEAEMGNMHAAAENHDELEASQQSDLDNNVDGSQSRDDAVSDGAGAAATLPSSPPTRKQRPKLKTLFAKHSSEEESEADTTASQDGAAVEYGQQSGGGSRAKAKSPAQSPLQFGESPTKTRAAVAAASPATKHISPEAAVLPVARKRVRRR